MKKKIYGQNKTYKILHISEEETENVTIEEIKDIEVIENKIKFKTSSFSTFVILQEKTKEELAESTNQNTEQNAETEKTIVELPMMVPAKLDSKDGWDGSTASDFSWGVGSKEEPFLIADGSELALLGKKVREGTSYDGQYFQLACDIDLGNKEWLPIGNNQNSFKGIFDGAGHTIGNAKITITDLPSANNYETYGIFASIGGGNNRTVIRNLELSNIDINITASGETGSAGIFNVSQDPEGFHIGCLSGAMYNNASILNVIVKNSIIEDSNVIDITDSPFQLSIGGVVGYITNTYNNNTTPVNLYEIENCYSEVTINIDATAGYSDGGFFNPARNGRGQYHTGGIVGTIRAQAVWPTNCLYSGTINSNGFIGPIFGGLINNVSYENASTFSTIWNGNNAGNITANNMYYTNFTAKGTTFTQSVTTGNSNARRVTNNTNDIGYVQGVNKGIYTTNMNNVLSMLNNNVTSENRYVNWYYQDNSFTFKERLTTEVTKTAENTYQIQVSDLYQIGNYTFRWYKNGVEDSSIVGTTYVWKTNYLTDENMVVVTYDGQYYAITKFVIKKFGVDIVFNINTNNDSVTATLEGEGLKYTSVEDYTFQWYQEDISGEGGSIEGETSLTLTGLEDGIDYRLVATNTKIPQLSTENSFTYGDRTVIYVNYSGGNNNNNGLTPDTPVKNLSNAYTKLSSTGNRNQNVIVIMGTYSSTAIFDSATSNTYAKQATITGKYKNVDYYGNLYFYGTTTSYRYLNADTTFQYLTFYGGGNEMYFYLQGYSLTMGEGVVMNNYATASSAQGLLGNNAPAFHIICGWLRYNQASLPRDNPKIIIKSGTYGRIIGGGSPGTTGASNLQQNVSRNFIGSYEDEFDIEITIDIKNSTTDPKYDYDVNLLVGGSACGNNYSNVIENIKSGSVGRLLGGSIGDSSDRPSNWNYPINTFLGKTTINITGGSIAELYGGCLGRNMSAIQGGWRPSTIICDSYFYGTVTVNMSAGTVTGNIYGAGAGGVTGYSTQSSDEYSSYGQPYDTAIHLNISGGTIDGNIYGGGYGYTEYLTESVTAEDGGSLYGDSYINISGSPTINGNIFAAGCGYNLQSKARLAQMYGNSNITIKGTPTINGKIFGAGAGLNNSHRDEMAKLVGNSTINIEANLNVEVYGGGNIALTEGSTNINIKDGIHTQDIYGGGNEGAINGNSNINISGGTQNRVFAGGNKAKVDSTTLNISGGTTNEAYAGGNQAEVTLTTTNITGGENNSVFGGGNSASVNTSNINIKGGTTSNIYGGSNQTGTVQNTNIEGTYGTAGNIFGGNNVGGVTVNSKVTINGSSIENSVYGGGNQVNTTNAEVYLINSGNNIPNIFGGGNMAAVSNPKVYCIGGRAQNVFGGSNQNGDIILTSVEITGGELGNIYGGNNQGGSTNTTNIYFTSGKAKNVYGGGNEAPTNTTNLEISGEVEENVYGGGNNAGVNTNTNVNLLGAIVGNNVYGGGNEGTISGNTFVHVKNSSIKNSLYAGGNGANAIVYGNTNLTMEGTTNSVKGSVFGGGNKAETGSKDTNNAKSTVNIVGGKIEKNVYGGANTSVVYGTTQTNIGYETVGNNSLEKGNIEILGTVFGGGEANEAGDENYDFSFISVTKGTDIQINGANHEKFAIKGSIFGSGNASSTSGESYITIKNYGTADSPQSNISLQRANCATIENSAISLSGATDRTNEFSNTYFSLSRVSRVKLKNNSILYLCNGANLLNNLDSLVDIDGQEIKGSVTIDQETGNIVRNVDNRIYMLEGKNLNIATNEQVTAYGQVSGMFFFGLFTNRTNPSTSTGFYHQGYENGEEITNAGTFSLNSYAMAQHMENHDTTVDGFYTNFNEEGIIKVKYIETSPKDDVYYMWLVGEKMDVTTFELSLTASKYATLGTYELLLQGFSDPNIKLSLEGFSSGLEGDVSLIDPDEIEAISSSEEKANTIYGLTMETGNTGWKTNGKTTFLTENGGTFTGTNNYDADNSTYTPTLNFCLYHSQNITLERNLGDLRIRLQVLTPIDDLNYNVSYIDIIINLISALHQDDFYEAAITPGQEFGLFTTTETTITDNSAFSTYYSLFLQNFSESEYYENYQTCRRVLVSRDSNNNPYVLPEGTSFTMLDMITDQFYYYVVTPEDVTNGKYIYHFSDFVAMGSEDKKFNESNECLKYYNQERDLIYENFIFHINFKNATLKEDIKNNTLLIELTDNTDETLIGVLGIQREIIKYTVYNNKNATIKLTATVEPETIYLGDALNLDVTTDFTQVIIDSKTVYDTQYFDKKLGIKITFYDKNGNRLNIDSLLGVNFELDGRKYYPRIDGTTRINIADKVTGVLAKIKVNTQDNTTLATGDYTIKIESFGSADGIYYGLEPSDSTELNIRMINSSYGLDVQIPDKVKIIDKEKGETLQGNNSLISTVKYSSSLTNPKITIRLERRDYSEEYSLKYELVDLQDYVEDKLLKTSFDREYLFSEDPIESMSNFMYLKPNLMTGTYKLVYKLYDNDVYVGEAYEYIIIK